MWRKGCNIILFWIRFQRHIRYFFFLIFLHFLNELNNIFHVKRLKRFTFNVKLIDDRIKTEQVKYLVTWFDTKSKSFKALTRKFTYVSEYLLFQSFFMDNFRPYLYNSLKIQSAKILLLPPKYEIIMVPSNL